MEKVSRRASKKQEKNKGHQQLRERRVLNRELGITASGNVAHVWWSGGLWWEQEDKKEGERRQRTLEMELLGKGEREVKGYCAAQMADSNVNLAHEMFQSGSSVFPEEEEEEGATLWWCFHKKAMLSPVPFLSKLVMLRDSDCRWRLGFQTAVASSCFLRSSLAPYVGRQLAVLLPSFMLSTVLRRGKRFSEVQNKLTYSLSMIVH